MNRTKPILVLLLVTAVALAGCSDSSEDDRMDGGDSMGDGDSMDDGMDQGSTQTENQGMQFEDDCVSSIDSSESGYAGVSIVTETGTIACEDVAGSGSNVASIAGCGDASVASVIISSDDAEAGTVQLLVTSGGEGLFDKTYTAEEIKQSDNSLLDLRESYDLTAVRSDDFAGGFAAVVQCTH